ncbi:hypothetical protein V8G54_019233 [Vigna mungo]|uniref:Uncharacterized protein n=1 Tax=Vigna mungo TaxID=3915 RepID=A0AAQ3NB31_VIGMU
MLKKGAGRLAKASPLMDTLPSLLPVSTSHIGLLNWTETASLAANASMSAHDTVPGHFSSNAAFMSSMTSKPDRDKFGIESFSAVLLAVESSKTEPSQPLTKQS